MAKRLLVLVCAVLLMESFFSAVLTPLVPAYRNELGLTDGATGILVAAYAAGSLLLALPAGWFASRFNPRKAVIVGLLGVGVSSVLFGFAGQLAVLEVSRFLLGAFGTLLWAGGLSWAISSTPVANALATGAPGGRGRRTDSQGGRQGCHSVRGPGLAAGNDRCDRPFDRAGLDPAARAAPVR